MDETRVPIVVVGGGLGGMRTVETIRRLGYQGSVTLVSEEELTPYDRPPLSKRLMASELGDGPPYLRAPDAYDDFCDLVLGHRAVALDVARREVLLDDGSRVRYGRLVLATGTRARRLDALGHDAHVVRDYADALRLREAVEAHGSLAVVGAGFMGCEIASAVAETGADVALIESAPTPLHGALGAEVGTHVRRMQEAAGVDVHCGVKLLEHQSTGGRHRLELVDAFGVRSSVEAAVLAACVGVEPAIDWLAGTGLVEGGAVACNGFGETSIPDVYAVGDIAAWRYPSAGRAVRVEHWTTTVAQATMVAHVLVNGPEPGHELDPLHYFWSDQCGVKLQCFGLPSASDDVEVAWAADGSLLAVYSRAGDPTAVLGIGKPKPLLALRARLMAQDSLAELTNAMHAQVAPTSEKPKALSGAS